METYIIVNRFSGIGRAQATRLTEELQKLGLSAKTLQNEVGLSLPAGSLAVFLDKDNYTAARLEKEGVTLLNSASAIAVCDDKYKTYLALLGKVPQPLTLSSAFCYTQDAPVFDDEVDTVLSALGLPLVVKLNVSSLGAGVFLCETRENLKNKIKELRIVPHVYQKFVASSRGVDVRVIVIGGKAVCAMQRKNAVDFRANVELGGIAEACGIKENFRAVAETAARELGLDYCGVDLLFGENGEPVLCEVNSNAFFAGIERATGYNVAQAYARHIAEKCQNR